jgi:hypothetical protein
MRGEKIEDAHSLEWRLVGRQPLPYRIREELPVIRQADDSGLSDKVLPKMLKTYCNPIETLLYMGIQ